MALGSSMPSMRGEGGPGWAGASLSLSILRQHRGGVGPGCSASRSIWVPMPARAFPSCVTLAKSLHLSEPYFSHGEACELTGVAAAH